MDEMTAIAPWRWGRYAAGLACVGVLLAGCSSSSSDDAAMVMPPATNTAPEITGAPAATNVAEGDQFSFTPTASDADGDTLTFSITNAPAWAAFDTNTGTLSGTPGAADAGVFANIAITVSDGSEEAELAPFDLTVLDVTAVTLSGMITDDPIAQAQVTVRVGEQTFETVADGQGAYSLEIRALADSLDPAALVEVRGLGVGAQEGVELVSQVGSLGQLIAAAGENAALGADDESRLTVSHLSTARYLLATDINDGSVPASEAELEEAESAIEAEELLTIAGLIKLIVEEALVPISADATSLAVLSADEAGESNADAIDALLRDNGLVDADDELLDTVRERLDLAIGSTLDDDALAIAFDAGEIAGTSVWNSPPQPGWVIASASVFDLDADGSGRTYEQPSIGGSFVTEGRFEVGTLPLTWTVDDEGDLVVTFVDNVQTFFIFITPESVVETYGFSEDVAEFLREAEQDGRWIPAQEEVRLTVSQQRSQILLKSTVRTLVRRFQTAAYDIDELLTRLQWPGDLPRGNADSEFDYVVRDVDNTGVSFANAPTAGETIALPVILSPQDARVAEMASGLGHDLITLLEGGQTTPGLLGQVVYDWSVVDGELLLEAGDESYRYRVIGSVGDLELWLATITLGDADPVRAARWASRLVPGGEALANDLVQELPIYWQAGINVSQASSYDDMGRFEFNQIFGYAFRSDGINTRIFASSYPACLDDPLDPCFIREGQDWLWTADGNRIVRALPPGGSLERERTWDVLRYTPGGRAVVLEYAVIDFGLGYEWFIFPRLNTQELYRLDEYPDAWQDSLDDGFVF